MRDPIPQEELSEIERMLTALRPAPVEINREQLLFRAGQAAARLRVRAWQVATAFFALAAGVVGFAWAVQSPPAPVVQVVHVPAPPPEKLPAPKPAPPVVDEPPPAIATPAPPRPTLAYFKLQDDLLRRGLDALGPLPADIGEPPPERVLDVTVPRGRWSPSQAWPFSLRGEL